jgi:hypothetical protein
MQTYNELIGELVIAMEEVFHEFRGAMQTWFHFDGIKNEKLSEAIVNSYQGSRSIEVFENFSKILFKTNFISIPEYLEFKKAFYQVVEIRNNIVHGKLTVGEMVSDDQRSLFIEGKKLGTNYKVKSFTYSDLELMETIKLCKQLKKDVGSLLLLTIKELYPNQVLCDLTLHSRCLNFNKSAIQ